MPGRMRLSEYSKRRWMTWTRRHPHRAANMTPEEIAAEYRVLSEAGRRWREEHPNEYDENNPPSKVWQEELYDEQGLPR